jgi:hypothetical protein
LTILANRFFELFSHLTSELRLDQRFYRWEPRIYWGQYLANSGSFSDLHNSNHIEGTMRDMLSSPSFWLSVAIGFILVWFICQIG